MTTPSESHEENPTEMAERHMREVGTLGERKPPPPRLERTLDALGLAIEERDVLEGAADWWYDRGMEAGRLFKKLVAAEDEGTINLLGPHKAQMVYWLKEVDFDERIGEWQEDMREMLADTSRKEAK